jgi:hypothetical protein
MTTSHQTAQMTVSFTTIRFGPESANRLPEASAPGVPGALAALETFYYAFNNRDAKTFAELWLNDPLIQLNNPVGGIMRGIEPIVALYTRIFDGPARVQVTFEDVVQYASSDMVVFAGRERGQYEQGGSVMPLEIRTSRVFGFVEGGWRQIHHHGSIDDADLLGRYQRAIRGQAPDTK